MLEKIKKYFNSRAYGIFVAAYIIFILIVIVFSADIFSPFHSFTNRSDSMNPTIDRGSLTIAKSFPEYKIGDAIAYYTQIDGKEEVITHRIMSIGGNVYTTKGDANAVADRELVKERLIIGKVVFIIPYLGYVITFAKSSFGTGLCIIFPALIIIILEITKIVAELKCDKKKQKEILQEE